MMHRGKLMSPADPGGSPPGSNPPPATETSPITVTTPDASVPEPASRPLPPPPPRAAIAQTLPASNPPPPASDPPPATVIGSNPPPPAQATRVARPTKKSNAGFIAISIGFVVLLVGGVVAWKVLLHRPPQLPFALAKLPSDTETVGRIEPTMIADTYALRLEDVPNEARWSYLSEALCGGTDVFEELLAVDRMDPRSAAALFADKDDLKATLACGKEISESLGKTTPFYRFRFKKGKQHYTVLAVPYAAKDLPETTKRLKSSKDPDHLENTRCLHAKDGDPLAKTPSAYPTGTPDDDYNDRYGDPDRKKRDKSPDADCAHAVAKIEKEKLWLSGDMPALKELGDQWSPEAKNRIDEAKAFEAVFASQRGDEIAAGHGDDKVALDSLGYVDDAEVREKAEKVLRDASVWGASTTLDGPFHTMRIEYHAAKDSDAQDIEDALWRYLKELKRNAKDAERTAKEQDEADSKKDDKSKPEEPTERKKLRLAMLKIRRRALEDATIERSGSVVTVTIADKPDDADRKLWKEFADWNRDRAKKAAAVIDALLKGDDPSDADLKALSTKLYDTLHPPDFFELAGFNGFRVPGGGECYAVDTTSQSCTYPKLDRAGVVAKLKEQSEKVGFAFSSQGDSDSSFLAQKDTTYVSISVFENAGSGAHVTLVLQPPPTPAPASTP